MVSVKHSYIFALIAFLLMSLALPAMADQVTPLPGPNKSYHYYIGDDSMEVFTGLPLTLENDVYPEPVFYIFVILATIFIFIAIYFISQHDNVPSIALMICGSVSAMLYLASAEMAPYVGHVDTFSTVVANVSNSGATPVGVLNSIYVTQVVTYQLTYWMGYVCWAGFILGFLILVAGVLSLFGIAQNWSERWKEKRLKKTGILEMDQDPDNL